MTDVRCLFCNLPVTLPEVDNVRYTDYAVVHIDCNKAKQKEVLDKKQPHHIRYK